MKIKLERIQEKINSVLNPTMTMTQIENLAKKVYLIVSLADEELMTKIYSEKIEIVFNKAKQTTQEIVIAPHSVVKTALEGSQPSEDISSLKKLADSLSDNDLEKLVILGFFLQESNFAIIKMYHIILNQNLLLNN